MGYPIYAILLTVSSSGLNVAISKVVAERWARGKKAGAAGAFRVSLVMMVVLGALGTAALYKGAPWIAANMGHDPRATASIRANRRHIPHRSIGLPRWFRVEDDRSRYLKCLKGWADL